MNEKGIVGKVYRINREKLEEAVKAILDELYKGCPEIVEKWIKEKMSEEGLKKKLKELVNELKRNPSPKGPPYSTYQEGWLDAMSLAVEKLEELLKKSKVESGNE